MDSEYGQKYRNLYEYHWWWRARERYVLDCIASLNLPVDAKILDIGCGDGLFFEALCAYGTPFGIEPDESLLSNRWRDNIYTLPFDEQLKLDQQFDLVLMLDVLEHLDDDLGALKAVSQLLKPGGKFIATVPALMSAWTAHDQVNHHRRRYRLGGFRTLLTSAGLSVRLCRYYFVWTYLPKFMLSVKERLFGQGTSETQTQIPSRMVNQVISKFSYWEHRIFHYVPAPFGTSIIASGERI